MSNYLTITYTDSSGQYQTAQPSTVNPLTGNPSTIAPYTSLPQGATSVSWYYYLLTDVYTLYSLVFNTPPVATPGYTFYTLLTGAPGPGANGTAGNGGYGGGGGAGEGLLQTYTITNNPDPSIPGSTSSTTTMNVYLVPESCSQDCYISLENNFFNFTLLQTNPPYLQNFANGGISGTQGIGPLNGTDGQIGGNGGNGGAGTNNVMFYSSPNLPTADPPYNYAYWQNGNIGGAGGNGGWGQGGNGVPGNPGNPSNTSTSQIGGITPTPPGVSNIVFQDGQSYQACQGGVAGSGTNPWGSSGVMPFCLIYYYVFNYN